MKREELINAISISEIHLLLDFVVRKGLDPENKLINPINDELNKLENDNGEQAKVPSSKLLQLYAQMCIITTPVNGRTLFHTSKKFHSHVLRISLYTIFFIIFAFGNELLRSGFADYTGPAASYLLNLLFLHKYILDPLAPFFWGGLGSCVFLLKRLTDLAADSSFCLDKLQGWKTRILLGSVLGGIVFNIFDTGNIEEGLKIGPNAMAFLTGVGVRVVYGAIEKAIATLADKMNLQTLRGEGKIRSYISTFINQEIANVDPDQEPDKRKILLELADKVRRSKSF